jgi:hypothetical protein
LLYRLDHHLGDDRMSGLAQMDAVVNKKRVRVIIPAGGNERPIGVAQVVSHRAVIVVDELKSAESIGTVASDPK